MARVTLKGADALRARLAAMSARIHADVQRVLDRTTELMHRPDLRTFEDLNRRPPDSRAGRLWDDAYDARAAVASIMARDLARLPLVIYRKPAPEGMVHLVISCVVAKALLDDEPALGAILVSLAKRNLPDA